MPKFHFANVPFDVTVSQLKKPGNTDALYTFSGPEAETLHRFFTTWDLKPSTLAEDSFTTSRTDILRSREADTNEIKQLLRGLKKVPPNYNLAEAKYQ
jgi:hypothetical protein